MRHGKYSRRLPLRERVAARRSGRSEYFESEEAQPKYRPYLKWFAIICQAASILLLLVEVSRMLLHDFAGVNFTQIGIYSGVFFLGRAIQIGLAIFR